MSFLIRWLENLTTNDLGCASFGGRGPSARWALSICRSEEGCRSRFSISNFSTKEITEGEFSSAPSQAPWILMLFRLDWPFWSVSFISKRVCTFSSSKTATSTPCTLSSAYAILSSALSILIFVLFMSSLISLSFSPFSRQKSLSSWRITSKFAMSSSADRLSVTSWHKLALLSSTGVLLVEGLSLDSLLRVDFFCCFVCCILGILCAPSITLLDLKEILAKLSGL